MLVRYDPFRDFDRKTSRRQWMPMDAVRHDQSVELRFDLPGHRARLARRRGRAQRPHRAGRAVLDAGRGRRGPRPGAAAGCGRPPGDARRGARHRPARRHLRRRRAEHLASRSPSRPRRARSRSSRVPRQPTRGRQPQLTVRSRPRLGPATIGGAASRPGNLGPPWPSRNPSARPSTRSRSGSSSSPSCGSRRSTPGAPAAVERQHKRGQAHRARADRAPARSRLVRRARHAGPPPCPRLRHRGHPAAHRRRGHRVGHRSTAARCSCSARTSPCSAARSARCSPRRSTR